MKIWPFRHRRTLTSPQPTDEAREALRQAKRGLADAERLDCHAQDVAARLEHIRAVNGFGAAVIRSIRGV